eukprot:g3253.t1
MYLYYKRKNLAIANDIDMSELDTEMIARQDAEGELEQVEESKDIDEENQKRKDDGSGTGGETHAKFPTRSKVDKITNEQALYMGAEAEGNKKYFTDSQIKKQDHDYFNYLAGQSSVLKKRLTKEKKEREAKLTPDNFMEFSFSDERNLSEEDDTPNENVDHKDDGEKVKVKEKEKEKEKERIATVEEDDEDSDELEDDSMDEIGNEDDIGNMRIFAGEF